MKKIIVTCLIIMFALGNICFAQAAVKDYDRHTYYIGAGTADHDTMRAPVEQCGGGGSSQTPQTSQTPQAS